MVLVFLVVAAVLFVLLLAFLYLTRYRRITVRLHLTKWLRLELELDNSERAPDRPTP